MVDFDALKLREEWLELRLQQTPNKGGWDIVLRVDGTYYNKDDAKEIMEHIASIIGVSCTNE